MSNSARLMMSFGGPLRKQIKRVAAHLSFTLSRNHGARRLRIPIIGTVGLENMRRREPGLERMLQSWLPDYPGTFVDIGANIGQTLLIVKSHDLNRNYIGVEVSPFCCYYLDRLIAENGFAGCTVVPIGLSDHSGSAELQFSDEHDQQATIVPQFWTASQAREFRRRILVEPGDAVLAAFDLPCIAFVKVDVEGAELEVLSGLRQTIARHRPLVITEILPYTPDAADAGDSPATIDNRRQRHRDLIALIMAICYVPFRILPDGTLERTFEFDMHEFDADLCNYLLAPMERLPEKRRLSSGVSRTTSHSDLPG
jgi:FkbM family methyltransferase